MPSCSFPKTGGTVYSCLWAYRPEVQSLEGREIHGHWWFSDNNLTLWKCPHKQRLMKIEHIACRKSNPLPCPFRQTKISLPRLSRQWLSGISPPSHSRQVLSGIHPHRRHSRHFLSGIHLGLLQRDPGHRHAGMTEGKDGSRPLPTTAGASSQTAGMTDGERDLRG